MERLNTLPGTLRGAHGPPQEPRRTPRIIQRHPMNPPRAPQGPTPGSPGIARGPSGTPREHPREPKGSPKNAPWALTMLSRCPLVLPGAPPALTSSPRRHLRGPGIRSGARFSTANPEQLAWSLKRATHQKEWRTFMSRATAVRQNTETGGGDVSP